MGLLHLFTSYKQRNLLSLFHTIFQECFYSEQPWRRETVSFSGAKGRLFKRCGCILNMDRNLQRSIDPFRLFFLSDRWQFLSFKKFVHFI